MEVTSRYPGSFGEILQGNLGEKPVLVSSPINLYTYVRLFESRKQKKLYKNIKANKFIENILIDWGYTYYINNIHIEINSKIPRGKGLASSTADLCATYKALTQLFKKNYYIEELQKNCLKIEPTDSIIFDEFTLFDYKNGSFKEKLGPYIKFYILVFQGNRIINTLDFNNIPQKMNSIEDLIPDVTKSIEKKDIKNIAKISEESIKRNFHRLSYDYFNIVSEYKNRNGGLGIIGCHSGDALGIVYDNKEDLMRVKKKLTPIKNIKNYTLETVLNIKNV
ncbi:kinase [Clostridium sp. Marseille-Q2269]|uniref:GHMP family kinase ATP-binding protein n=1 Tax=Clostridium sp. Marseille-Q2269 TaxID=2942205 RepID=UPI002074ABA2|nr:kinase [Clostridium sp. Marseille-Q2269]